MSEKTLNGIPAAPGVVYGSVFILDEQEFIVSPRSIYPQEVAIEVARFEEAIQKTQEELKELKSRIENNLDHQSEKIFDAHILLLNDKSFLKEVTQKISETNNSAEYVFSIILKKYVSAFSNIEDEYLKERAVDINDIGRRVLKHLTDESKLHDLETLNDDVIVVAHDISPSVAVGMCNKKLLAFLTDIGGRTSHTAIIAKSLGVPAVVGLEDATLHISNQDKVIVDGNNGIVIINPLSKTIAKYQKEKDRFQASRDSFHEVRDLPAETIDGKKVSLLANVDLVEDVEKITDQGAEGVGLYRTEFLFMNRKDLPTEEEQFIAYKKIVEAVKPYPVTIRTLDLGGDKFISSIETPKDMDGFLGVRALRFCLDRPDIFKTQLRAILRASHFGVVKIMYPMVAGLTEFREANCILEEAKKELKNEGIDFSPDIAVGIMIEVPAAAILVDIFAEEVDFFSIGTNDLIQYTLAVDRVSEKTAHLYEPQHPAIIRLIKQVVAAAHQKGIKVSVCGEISSEPAFSMLLLGLGVDEMSMSTRLILQIKSLIRSLKYNELQKMIVEIMSFKTSPEVESYLKKRFKELVPHF